MPPQHDQKPPLIAQDSIATIKIFQHAPLDHATDSIRLIRILPDTSSEGLIQCTLQHTTITDAMYTCLSYEWGLEDYGNMISINGGKHHVGQNLLDFLDNARSINAKPAMWIDALCIDQGNSSERSHQVHLMGSIYSGAEEVWSWLGNDERIIALFSDIERYRERGLERPHGACRKSWRNLQEWALSNLMGAFGRVVEQHSYWTRAWITQEVMLARKLRLVAKNTMKDADEYTQGLFVISFLRDKPKNSGEPKGLLALLSELSGRRCKIKRDVVYSLLALCREGTKIEVDYSISDAKVLLQVLEACNKTLCLCSPTIVARALDLHQFLEGLMVVRHAKLKRLKLLGREKDYTTCDECGSIIAIAWQHIEPVAVSHIICFRNKCSVLRQHVLWEQPSRDSQTSKIVFRFSAGRGRYTCLSYAKGPPGSLEDPLDSLSILIPLRIVQIMYKGYNGEWVPEHLDEEKGWLKMYDPSEDLSAEPHIQVTDLRESLDTHAGCIAPVNYE